MNFINELNQLTMQISRNANIAAECPCDPCICEYYDSCDKLLALMFKRMLDTDSQDRMVLYPETYKLIDGLF